MTIPPSRRAVLAPLLAAALAALTPLPVSAEDGGISSITQIGEANTTSIRQKFIASGGLGDRQNTATVSQTGTANSMDITQEGNTLTATVTQHGANNTGTIEQYGNGHSADVQQTGDGHGITIRQDNFLGAKASDPSAVITGSGPGSTVVVRQF